MTSNGWPSDERIAETEKRIREFLAAGDGRRAVNEAVAGAQAAAAFARQGNGELAGLADAYLAATVLALAVRWPGHEPQRPPGVHGKPGGEDFAALFDQVLADTLRSTQ